MKVLGEYSYSIYLWQQIVLVVAVPANSPIKPLTVGPASWACLFIMSLASRYLIEKPFLKLKRFYSA